MAAEGGKIDPMHQFQVEPLLPLNVGGYDLSFTNSALFMVLVLGVIWVFMLGNCYKIVACRFLDQYVDIF